MDVLNVQIGFCIKKREKQITQGKSKYHVSLNELSNSERAD